VREQVAVAFAFDHAVTGEEDDDHILPVDRAGQGGPESAAHGRESGRLIGQERELVGRETAAVRAAEKIGEVRGVAMGELELIFGGEVLIVRDAYHDCPELAAPVERAATAKLFDIQLSGFRRS
jgi:hypothetical protein